MVPCFWPAISPLTSLIQVGSIVSVAVALLGRLEEIHLVWYRNLIRQSVPRRLWKTRLGHSSYLNHSKFSQSKPIDIRLPGCTAVPDPVLDLEYSFPRGRLLTHYLLGQTISIPLIPPFVLSQSSDEVFNIYWNHTYGIVLRLKNNCRDCSLHSQVKVKRELTDRILFEEMHQLLQENLRDSCSEHSQWPLPPWHTSKHGLGFANASTEKDRSNSCIHSGASVNWSSMSRKNPSVLKMYTVLAYVACWTHITVFALGNRTTCPGIPYLSSLRRPYWCGTSNLIWRLICFRVVETNVGIICGCITCVSGDFSTPQYEVVLLLCVQGHLQEVQVGVLQTTPRALKRHIK